MLKQVQLIDAPGQCFHKCLQRPEFRAHRQRLDEVKREAQHVATCMRRIQQRLLELCGCEELGAHRARLDQAKQAADKAVSVTPLVEELCQLLAPDERELLGLDHDNVTRAVRLEEGDGLKLRRLLAEWGSPSFVCRNGIIADWNPVMAACTAGNAVPLTLGAGSASKATAMYSIKYMGKDSVNISASASVLHEAHNKVHDHPSSADDKCTAERTSKHFCQHVINHAACELEATQAAGVVLGIKSYGRSDDLDYHSAWDHIKVAAYAESGLLKQRPGLHDVALEDDSDMCRATCANGKPCRSRVHPKAGQEGHCEGTCGRHKHLRPENLRPRAADGQHTSARRGATEPSAASTGEGTESDADIVVSDSDTEVDDDDLFARDNVDAQAAAGMAEGGATAAAGAAVGAPRSNDGPQRTQRDLLAFFKADGGATSGSCNLFKDSDGNPVVMCSAYNYAYRDSRLRDFNPVEFRRRFHVVKMEPEQAAFYRLRSPAASFIAAWWRLKDRRGRRATADTREFDTRLQLLEQARDWIAAAEYAEYKREQLRKKVTHFYHARAAVRYIQVAVRSKREAMEAQRRNGTAAQWGLSAAFATAKQAWRRSAFFVTARQAWFDVKDSVAPAVSKRPYMCYWLSPPHPLHDTYAILPRTKWGVLALPGAPPPKELSGGIDPTTRKSRARARNIALYYLSNFTPWSAFEPPRLEYDAWKQYCEVQKLVASHGRPLWEGDAVQRAAVVIQAWARRRAWVRCPTGPMPSTETEAEDVPCELKTERRKARYIAAARLFDIENVMTGFRAPKVCTWADSRHVCAHVG